MEGLLNDVVLNNYDEGHESEPGSKQLGTTLRKQDYTPRRSEELAGSSTTVAAATAAAGSDTVITVPTEGQ
jgi:hypothetical protein